MECYLSGPEIRKATMTPPWRVVITGQYPRRVYPFDLEEDADPLKKLDEILFEGDDVPRFP